MVCRGATVAFVEVKARDELDAAAGAIRRQAPPHRPRRPGLAGAQSLGGGATLRGDAVFIAPDAFPATSPRRIALDLD